MTNQRKPLKRKRNRPATRRTFKRSYGNSTLNRSVGSMRSGPALRQAIRLVYCTGQIATTTTTVPHVYSMASNGVFLPDLTGTSHQPHYFDQYAALYYRYRVIGCKITIDGHMLTANTAGRVWLGSTGFNNTAPSDRTILEESPGMKAITVTIDKPFKIVRYFPSSKVESIQKSQYNDEVDFSAGIGANPVRTGQVSLSYQNLDASTSTGWNIQIQMEYDVIFSDPRSVATS